MPATRRGIYHNLKESKYTVSNTEIVYFFSSQLYLNKFMVGYKENRKKFGDKIERAGGYIPLNMDMLADICFYQDVETRGFRVLFKTVEMDRDSLYKYALRKMNVRETLEWSAT